MRKLAWAALGFAAAAGLSEYLLPAKGLPYLAAALAIFGLGASLTKKPRRAQAAILLLAAAAGLLSWWGRYTCIIRPSEEKVGQTVHINATVTDFVEHRTNYDRINARVSDGGIWKRAAFYLYEGLLPDLAPGDTVEAEVRLTSVLTRQGARNHYFTAEGVSISGYIQPDTLSVTGRSSAWRYLPQRLSQAVKDACDRLFSESAAPFLKALLTGDTADLEDSPDYTAMQTAGVMHVVAISGMHLFVLVGFIQLLFGRGRRTSILCLPAIALFTLMAGCRPSVVRAAVMQSLYLLAPVLDRESDGTTCLGAALLALLAVNPMAIGSVGLQLSFACMAGLVFLLPGIMAWADRNFATEKRLVALVTANLACTIGATAFSLPLAAFYFGQVPLFSPIANLLTLLVVEFCFAAGYAVCALGAIWPAAGLFLGRLMDVPVGWCMLVYRSIGSLPFASLGVSDRRAAVWLLGVYALFILWYVLKRRGHKVRVDVPICLALIGLALVLFSGKLALPPGTGRLAVLDVGQGECVVLADEAGAVVIDCGSTTQSDTGQQAADYLLSIGKTKVDALVLTHLHADHANGAVTLLYRMDVGTVILPAEALEDDYLREPILAAAESQGTDVMLLAQDSAVQAGGVDMTLLLPQPEGGKNERGIVVLADILDRSVLVMGDAGFPAEMELLSRREVPDVDILVAGHHGSPSASGALFLRAAQAETAIVSVGYNTYGHPADSTLDRLYGYCDRVLRTDQQGDITVKFTQEGDTYG